MIPSMFVKAVGLTHIERVVIFPHEIDEDIHYLAKGSHWLIRWFWS
jgi:hypothetical protein